jgi:hypothetical protein
VLHRFQYYDNAVLQQNNQLRYGIFASSHPDPQPDARSRRPPSSGPAGAQVPQFVAEGKPRSRQGRLHPNGGLANIQYNLPWKPLESAKRSDGIFCHPLRHFGIVAALKLQMRQRAAGEFAQQIHSGVPTFGQFDIQPSFDRAAVKSPKSIPADPRNNVFSATSHACKVPARGFTRQTSSYRNCSFPIRLHRIRAACEPLRQVFQKEQNPNTRRTTANSGVECSGLIVHKVRQVRAADASPDSGGEFVAAAAVDLDADSG